MKMLFSPKVGGRGAIFRIGAIKMPIEALSTVAGPLASLLQPRAAASHAMPDSSAQAIQGPGKAPDETGGIPSGPTFGEYLQHAIGEVNQAQLHAGDLSTRFAAGEPIDVHQVMIAAQE